MSEINLSSAVRTSLSSLQSTADLLSSTQERLATGNRVNSALDDPTAFFTASALNNRASDLSTLLDSQQQAIRTVEAADQGISAIEDLVDSARAQATAALQTEDPAARAEAAAAFDEIVGQIQDLAGDSGFNGTNLLAGDNLGVVFNESSSSSLTIEGVDFTDAAANLGLSAQGGAAVAATNSDLTGSALGTIADGDEVVVTDGTTTITFTAGDSATANQAAFDAAVLSAGGAGGITFDGTDFASSAGTLSGTVGGGAAVAGTDFEAATGGSFATEESINAALASIDVALSTLRSSAASLGSDLSTVQIRQDFTSSLINTLEAGAGDLTLADLNEEGANLLTLQTRQQLASTSLSFATQSDQSVLSLF